MHCGIPFPGVAGRGCKNTRNPEKKPARDFLIFLTSRLTVILGFSRPFRRREQRKMRHEVIFFSVLAFDQ